MLDRRQHLPAELIGVRLMREASGVVDSYGAPARGRLDLLPSSLNLIDLQERLAGMTSGRFCSNVPTDILRRAINPVIDEYDWVLIDCPPSMSIITLNGLRISAGFVIPTIPDLLSTYGIPQIRNRAQAFSDNIGETIERYGVIISKYREQSSLHQGMVQQLRADEESLHVFKTVIPERSTTAMAVEHARRQTFRQRYGFDGDYEVYASLAKELRDLVGQREPAVTA